MCTRAKERKHYTDEDIDDDEIEGKRNYNLDDKLHSVLFEGNFVMHMRGDEFNMKFFQEHGLVRPIVFFDKTGLGMRVPSENFQVSDVKQCVGSRRPLDVMDANTQRGLEMTMKEWVKYYENKEREKLLNVISLEFSHTKLENYVESPTVVRQTDWVDTVWPRIYKKCQTESTNIIEKMKYPKVQKYCLMSVAGCFTDFHVDFGGTSVWYHILHGQKVFWLIPPTEVNIELYVNWVLSGKQGDIFLGDQVDSCQRITLEEGYTFVIPSGWIHAVYTPKDSLVFGGNFLHSFNIQEQLTVCEIEEKTHVPQKFRYPFFTEISWYVLDRYLACLTGKSFLQKSAIDAEKDEDSELDDSRPPSRDPEEYAERAQVRADDKDPKNSQPKLSKSITIELTRIDEKNLPRASSDEEGSATTPVKGGPNRPGRKSEAGVIGEKAKELRPSRSPADVDERSETEDALNEKESKEDLLKDGVMMMMDGFNKVIPKKNLHLTLIELKGLEKLVEWLEALPPTKKNVPKDISEPENLLKEFKQLLVDHQSDDPILAATGEPILQWPPSKKLKPKLKLGHYAKGKLMGKTAAAQAASNIRRRRTRCKKCEPCTRQECAECHFCKDMKKFGGPGRMKQSCISRQCMAPVLPLSASCMICCKEGAADKGENTEDSISALMECGICWEIVHPNCFKLKNGSIEGEGVMNEDLPNSWECPRCCQDGKRGQIKPRVIKKDPKPKAIESRHSSTSSDDFPPEVAPPPATVPVGAVKQEASPVFEGKRVTAKESISPTSNGSNLALSTRDEIPALKSPTPDGEPFTEATAGIEPVSATPALPLPKIEPLDEKEATPSNKRKTESKLVVSSEEKTFKKRKLPNGRRNCESSPLGASFVTRSVRRVKRSSSLSSRPDATISSTAAVTMATSAAVSMKRPRRQNLVDTVSNRPPTSTASSSADASLRERRRRPKRAKTIGRPSRAGSGPLRRAAAAAQAKLRAAGSDLTLDEDDEDFVLYDDDDDDDDDDDSSTLAEAGPASRRTSGNTPAAVDDDDDSVALSEVGPHQSGNIPSAVDDDDGTLSFRSGNINAAVSLVKGFDGSAELRMSGVADPQKPRPATQLRLEPPIYVIRPAPVPPPPDYVVTATPGEERHALRADQWKRIFSYLTPADLARCMRVCKTWNQWCLSPGLWITIDLSGRRLRRRHLIGTVCRQPKRLDLSSARFSGRQLRWLLPRLAQLKELRALNCSWAGLSPLCSASCPLLRSLDLSWCVGVAEDCFRDLVLPPANRKPGMKDLSRLNKLTNLNLTGTEVTDNNIELLANHLPGLEDLNLSYCMQISDRACISLAGCEVYRRNFRTLSFAGCQRITGACLHCLASFESLVALDFSRCPRVGRNQLDAFAAGYEFRKLRIDNHGRLVAL